MMNIHLPEWLAAAAGVLLIAGGLFTLIGACGLMRLRDFYSRMHAPTLGATLGTGCILISSMLVTSAVLDRPVIHEIVLASFIVITAPVSAILLMRAAISRERNRGTQQSD